MTPPRHAPMLYDVRLTQGLAKKLIPKPFSDPLATHPSQGLCPAVLRRVAHQGQHERAGVCVPRPHGSPSPLCADVEYCRGRGSRTGVTAGRSEDSHHQGHSGRPRRLISTRHALQDANVCATVPRQIGGDTRLHKSIEVLCWTGGAFILSRRKSRNIHDACSSLAGHVAPRSP